LEHVKLIPDGSGEFTRKMEMLVAKDNLGFGMRSWRYGPTTPSAIPTDRTPIAAAAVILEIVDILAFLPMLISLVLIIYCGSLGAPTYDVKFAPGTASARGRIR
jgi:hypothetical protein